MPWQNSVFNLLIVVAGAGYSGEFSYSPAPGAGNLIASNTASDGTDPYGNAYVHGLITYTVTGGIAIAQGWQDGTFYFATAATQAGPYVVASGQLRALPGGYLNSFHSGNDVGGNQDPVTLTQFDAHTIIMAGRLLAPGSGSISGISFGNISGTAFVLPPGPVIPEFPTANASGAASGSVVLRPDGNLQCYGGFVGSDTVITAGTFHF